MSAHGELDGQLCLGFSSMIAPSFSFAMRIALIFVWLKHEVAVDDHAHRESRPDRECRLNVEVALNNFLSGLIEAIAGSPTQRRDDIAVGPGTGSRSKFAANAEQC